MNRLFLAGTALSLAVGATACDEGLTEVNRNPNEPESVAPEYILADAQASAIGGGFGTHGVWFGLYLTDIWPQHLAQIQYNSEDQYILRPAVMANVWNTLYSGPLANLKVLKDMAGQSNTPNQAAVAEILSQYIYQVLTDHWGPIPYSEALGGAEGRNSPKFDSQEEVYNGMLSKLAAASTQIQPAGAKGFASGDLMYKGDMDKWRRFSNSLRMRMAMRIVDRNPAKARTEFEAAMAAGGFTSNADNARLVYGTGINSQNPHYDVFVNQNRYDFVVSETIVDTLKSLADPRLAVYANPARTDGEFRGLRNGRYPSAYSPPRILNDFSSIGSAFLAAESPSVLQSYSEVLFLRAEAAARGWNAGGTAADLYRQAVTASLQQHGVSAAAISAYLARPRVAFAGGSQAAQLQQIWLQKWIALYMNGPEAYSEIRRTDTPALQLAANAAESTFPKRLSYPTTEQTLNKANYTTAVGTLTGGDVLSARLWWDVR